VLCNQIRYVLGTGSIKLFVLDEADEMLSRGFKDQIHDVFKMLNTEVQVMCYLQYEVDSK
jgi:translation initiation factor 4A